MATLRICVPDATTNYIENPAFRYATTGWTAVGSALTRVLTEARWNVASCRVVTNGSALYEGLYYRVSRLSGISEPVSASVYVRGSGTVRLRLIDNPSGQQWTSKAKRLRTDRWLRLTVTGRSTGSDDMRLYVETDKTAQAVTFYVDGAQMERHPYSTTYCDGDQEDCMWAGTSHASQSSRTGFTRAGGRWVSIAGCERDDPDIYLTVIGGMGVAPIRNNTQSYANAPGSYHQNSKTLDRVVTLSFNVKAADTRRKTLEASLKKLHQLRQKLFDVIKPDRTPGSQEFLIEYQDGAYPMYFKAVYDGGMEGEWDIRNQWINSFPVRLLVVSPYFTEDTQEAAQLGIRDEATVNYIMQRFDGQWSEMNGGMNAEVLDMAIGSQGEIIAVGNFILANNKVTAIDPQIFANYVCYWDGRQWRGYGTGADGIINAVAVAPNGDVIVTGNFTNIGGAAANRIARWVKATSTWTALGAGLTGGAGFDVAVAPNGDVYVVGAFTHAGGQLMHYCARYDGAWHSLSSQPGLNNYVYAIAISTDGSYVYLGGDFTDEWGDPATLDIQKIVGYEVSGNSFFELGDGFDNTVLDLVYAPSGRLYACGEFTLAPATSDQLRYMAYWNGAQWAEIGGGADNTVRCLSVSKSGYILACGDFTTLGNVNSKYVGYWNGSSWVNLDVAINAPVYAIMFDQYDNIFTGSGVVTEFASITPVNNIGTAETNPILYLIGPGTLRWVENQVAQKRVYGDVEILEDEEVILDFATGKITSTVRGDLTYTILSGSDISAWKLLPGNNDIAVLFIEDVGASAYMYYVPRHWSADATQRGDSL